MIATMTIPQTIAFGPDVLPILNTDIDVQLKNVTQWIQLWKQWVAHSRNDTDAPEAIKKNTWWLIESRVEIRMAGVPFRNIAVSKKMIWNGGLDYPGKYLTVKMTNSAVSNPLKPKIRLDFMYINFGKMGFNLSTFAFSVYSLYRDGKGNESTQPVRIMDTKMDNFYY